MKSLSPVAAFAALSLAPSLLAVEPTTSPTDAPKPARRTGFLSGLGTKKETRPESLRFTLESAVAKALEANRELRAAAYLVNEASARADGAGRLRNPELEFGAAPGLHAKGSAYTELAFTQRFPLSSRLKLERDYARAELDAAREEVLIARRSLVGEIKRDAVRLISLRDEAALLRRQQDNARKLADSARARVAKGEGDALEAGFLDLESADHADEITRLEAERAALLAEFRRKIGLKPGDDADVIGELPANRDAFGLPDPLACPECRKLTILAKASQTNIELQQAKKWDDIGMGLFAQWEHDAGNTTRHEDITYVGVKVSVPLPLWSDNAAGVAAAKAKRDRMNAELAAEIQRLDGLVLGARREYETLSRRLPDIREKLLPAAHAQVDRIKASLAKGEGNPADLYRALDKLTILERRELALRRDIALALVSLETALSAHPSLKDPVVTPPVAE